MESRKRARTTEVAGASAEAPPATARPPSTPVTATPPPPPTTCPFLDTVNRHHLDFDFAKQCSVSGHDFNVYACLVCGKFFQGRGTSTHAYTHSLHDAHHVFINLHTARVYCLPDGYEILDASLRDIQDMLDPHFAAPEIARLDASPLYARSIDGAEYMPGLVGLNSIRRSDHVNVIIQSLVRVPLLRDYFLRPEHYAHALGSPLVIEFGRLTRKVWSPHNFKGHVSPHELLQAISQASKNRFKVGVVADPMDLLAWLLNSLHACLGGTRRPGSSVIHDAFQGTVRVTTEAAATTAAARRGDGGNNDEDDSIAAAGNAVETQFLFLTVDVPPPPLFKDALERNIIPQVPIFSCLSKFDGRTSQEMTNGDRRRYVITRLPRHLILHVKRFSKNTQGFVEKNPTIVNTPVRNLDLAAYCDASATATATPSTKYDLISSVQHDGSPERGSYRVCVHFRANKSWYELQDLHCSDVHPQLVSVSESYIQFYASQQSLAEREPVMPMRED